MRRVRGLSRGAGTFLEPPASPVPPHHAMRHLRRLWGAGQGQKGKLRTLPFLPTVQELGLGQGVGRVTKPKDWRIWGGWEWGSERQIPSPPLPLMLEPPFLPLAGAGHFVQILVNTSTPSPLQRSLKELPLSPPVFKLLHPPPSCQSSHLQPVAQ